MRDTKHKETRPVTPEQRRELQNDVTLNRLSTKLLIMKQILDSAYYDYDDTPDYELVYSKLIHLDRPMYDHLGNSLDALMATLREALRSVHQAICGEDLDAEEDDER